MFGIGVTGLPASTFGNKRDAELSIGLSFKWLGLSMTGDPKGQAESRRPKLFGLKAESEVPVYLDLHTCPKPWPNMQEWIVSDSISSTGSIVLGILQVQVDGRKVTSRRITAPIDY